MRIVVSPQYGGVKISARIHNGTIARNYSFEELNGPRALGVLKDIAAQGALECIVFHLLFGADSFKGPVRVTPHVVRKMDELMPLFPFYIPYAKAALSLFSRIFPKTPMVAFFETSFFTKLDSVNKYYAIPQEYRMNTRIKKFGYHGILHETNSRLFGRHKKVVSIVFDTHTTISAVADGVPKTISLGYTPLEGVMTRTSCGDLDPGIVFYLMNQYEYSLHEIDDILKRKSGFAGITGYDLTMEEFSKLYGKDRKVTLAFDVYQNQVLKYIGESIAALGDIDEIVISGTKIDTYAQVIYRLLKEISFLGISLRALPWDRNKELLQATLPHSPLGVWVNRQTVEDILFKRSEQLEASG